MSAVDFGNLDPFLSLVSYVPAKTKGMRRIHSGRDIIYSIIEHVFENMTFSPNDLAIRGTSKTLKDCASEVIWLSLPEYLDRLRFSLWKFSNKSVNLIYIAYDYAKQINKNMLVFEHGTTIAVKICQFDFSILSKSNVNLSMLESVMKTRTVDLTFNSNAAIRTAATQGFVDLVRALMRYPEVNPADFDNLPIEYAAEKGHAEVIIELLKDKRVDPSCHCQKPIRNAVENGHVEAVKTLLLDPRVDASINGFNLALRAAALGGHVEVVEVLLQDPKIIASPAFEGQKTFVRQCGANVDPELNFGYDLWQLYSKIEQPKFAKILKLLLDKGICLAGVSDDLQEKLKNIMLLKAY